MIIEEFISLQPHQFKFTSKILSVSQWHKNMIQLTTYNALPLKITMVFQISGKCIAPSVEDFHIISSTFARLFGP